jgi:predicted amidohydrolase YtcJ
MAEVEVAVTRVSYEDRTSAPFLASEALTLEGALRAFTRGTAYVNHLDDITGSLEPDKLADIVVLDRDVFARDAGPIGDARVLLTLVEGQAVHEDPGLERHDTPGRVSTVAVDR